MPRFTLLAQKIMDRCEQLGAISQADFVDRRYLTAEHKAANTLVSNWMTEAGMNTWQDSVGNQWGRYKSSNPNADTLLLGSHLDTVPNGGKYDGMLGVVAAVGLVEHFNNNDIVFPFHIDVVGFADEEGTRFGSTLLGSKALTGKWQPQWAELIDIDGISLRQAMLNFGLNFDEVHKSRLPPNSVKAYIELHIEQGPVLESMNLPVGIVTAIAGARRFTFTVTGFAGHAGTVPMPLRKDALCAASEMILQIEDIASKKGIVATVGKIENKPNGVNVIAGKTMFGLDIRSENDDIRDSVLNHIVETCSSIANRRKLSLTIDETHAAKAVQCNQALQLQLINACNENGVTTTALMSGAGHDAMAIADICPVAMLFTRCYKGISHHPAEAIQPADVKYSVQVLDVFIRNFNPNLSLSAKDNL